MDTESCHNVPGLEIRFLFRESDCIFKCYLKVLCMEASTSLDSLRKFEGAEGEFNEVLAAPGNFEPQEQ